MTARVRLAGAALALASAAGLAAPSASAAPTSLYVGSCRAGSYATIQDAVDAVSGPGRTIWVCPGTYEGDVLVDGARRLTIRNLPVRNQRPPVIETAGIEASGIAVQSSRRVQVRGLGFVGGGYGVRVMQSPRTLVSNVTASGAGFGVVVVESPDSAVRDVVARASGFGVAGVESPRLVLANNLLLGSTFGVAVVDSAGAQVRSNGAVGGSFGFTVASDGVEMVSNRVKRTTYGLVLNSGNGAQVDGLVVRDAQFGVVVNGGVTDATITDAVIRDGSFFDVVDNSTSPTPATWVRARCTTSTPSSICGASPSDDARHPEVPDREELRRRIESGVR